MILTIIFVLNKQARVMQQRFETDLPPRGTGPLPNRRAGGFKLRGKGGLRWKVLRRDNMAGPAAVNLRRAKRAARAVFGAGFLD